MFGGGFPGMEGMGGGRRRKVDNSKFYELLVSHLSPLPLFSLSLSRSPIQGSAVF